MSVIIVTKVPGDTAKFRQSLTDRAGEYVKFAESARAAGAIRHRFGIGDGFVLVVDEWGTPEQFEQFFSDPELQKFIGSVGGAQVPPEVTVCEAVASADQF